MLKLIINIKMLLRAKSIERSTQKKLKDYATPSKINDANNVVVYTKNSTRVHLKNEISKAFTINTGGVQGGAIIFVHHHTW